MTELQAYVAGFFDGEGCVGASQDHGTYRLRVAVTQKRPEILHLLKCRYGGNVYGPYSDGCCKWHIGGDGAVIFLQDILPYLCIKGAVARVGLVLGLRPNMSNKPPAQVTAEYEARERLALQIKELNRGEGVRRAVRSVPVTTPTGGSVVAGGEPA